MIEFNVGRWITGTEAAERAGVTPVVLRARRTREGERHPRFISLGPVVLYPEAEFMAYADAWTDRRGR